MYIYTWFYSWIPLSRLPFSQPVWGARLPPLHCTIQYYTILYYAMLYYNMLYYTTLYDAMLYYTILYYTILYCTMLSYNILYYTIPYHTIPYYNLSRGARLPPHVPTGAPPGPGPRPGRREKRQFQTSGGLVNRPGLLGGEVVRRVWVDCGLNTMVVIFPFPVCFVVSTYLLTCRLLKCLVSPPLKYGNKGPPVAAA